MKRTFIYISIFSFSMIAFAIALAGNTNIKASLTSTLSDTIFVGSSKLNGTIVTYTSNTDISQYSIHSGCNISSKFISRELNNYSFSVRYNDQKCGKDTIFLKDSDGQVLISSQAKLKVYSDFELYNRFTDYSSDDLKNISKSLSKKIDQYSIFSEYSETSGVSKYDFYAKKIRYYQYKYNAAFIAAILTYREHKYIVPVAGKSISTKESHLPNALRPYRSSYTDGIHHGWDVSGAKGEQTIALDHSIVTRVVNDFSKSSFDKIVYGNNLSDQQKLENLDVLRGNQVWLKTMKGDYVFYSHLGDISVEVGDVVFAGDPIGTIDVTGVPGDDYHDYHLHFPIHPNPYNSARAGSYKYSEIMSWPWYFKGKSVSYVREHQSDVFK
ncbi:M23 family metallopeptidase [Candidatus Gracilibacteria bacterium]|nr:M23 family metallopeptidase [Candidatus Gracilibacteria bacterium]